MCQVCSSKFARCDVYNRHFINCSRRNYATQQAIGTEGGVNHMGGMGYSGEVSNSASVDSQLGNWSLSEAGGGSYSDGEDLDLLKLRDAGWR